MKLHRFIGDFNLAEKTLFSEEKELIHQLKSVLKIMVKAFQRHLKRISLVVLPKQIAPIAVPKMAQA